MEGRWCLQKGPGSDSRYATQRTVIVHAEPSIDTARMVDVPAFGQLSHPLPPGKVLQAD